MRLLAFTLVALGLTASPLMAQASDPSSSSTAPADAVDADSGDAGQSDDAAPVDADAPSTETPSGSAPDDADTAASAADPAVEETAPNAPTAESTDAPATVDETVVEVQEQEEALSVDDVDSDEPSILERQIVAFVASGVSVSSLAVGIVVGFLAWQQFNCLQNVLSCNETLAEPIHGADYFTARSNVEHLALIADMAYLFAGAAAIVAVTGFIRGFLLTGEREEDEDSTTTSSRPQKPSGLARALPDVLDARGEE